jgi:HEAT repeat protein
MNFLTKAILAMTIVLFASAVCAQEQRSDAEEELRIAAMEALITAPAERALPLVKKVLAGNHSNELKERALFILSQIDDPDAQATLLEFATGATGDLRLEAIRMIGIGGDSDNIRQLKSIYLNGDREARDAVLEAYMIVGDKEAIFEIAKAADGEDFEEALQLLSAMGARDELRQLATQHGPSEALVHAYAVSGDFDALRELAMDNSDPDIQAQAVEAMGIIGDDRANEVLLQLYGSTDNPDVREAALDGMMIAGNDAGILELYRSETNPAVRKELLEYLVIMKNDEVWEIIDAALSEDQ